MTTLTLRNVKGAPLTWSELDANFTSLNSDKLEAQDIAAVIHEATVKTTPVDADEIGFVDSVTGLLAKMTFANLKEVFGLENQITAAPSKDTPVDADTLGFVDSADGGKLKKLTFANLVTWIKSFCWSLTQQPTFRNKIINGGFNINQRVYVSGASTTAGQYTLDRWKVTGTGGITFSTTANKTTITIPTSQTLQQVVEGLNLQSGTYILSWEGTAQGRIGGGSYGASGTVTAAITGGTNTTIEFGPGTVANVQLEAGSIVTPFETRPIGTELELCQRYFCTSYIPGTAVGTITQNGAVSRYTDAAGQYCSVQIVYPVSMRTGPTLTIYGVLSGATSGQVSGDGTNKTGGVIHSGSTNYAFAYTANVASGAGEYIRCNFIANAEL